MHSLAAKVIQYTFSFLTSSLVKSLRFGLLTFTKFSFRKVFAIARAMLQESLNYFAPESNCCFDTSPYLIAENITVIITLAPCNDKPERHEAWDITGHITK